MALIIRRSVQVAIRMDFLGGGQRRRRFDRSIFQFLPFQEVRGLHLRYGRYLPSDEGGRGERVAVIGGKLQAELFLGENPIGRSFRLGQERYRVIGVFTPRGVSLGTDLDEVVHIPVDQAMRMFNVSGVTQVMVEVRAHEEIPAARTAVFELLKERHDGHEDVTVDVRGRPAAMTVVRPPFVPRSPR